MNFFHEVLQGIKTFVTFLVAEKIFVKFKDVVMDSGLILGECGWGFLISEYFRQENFLPVLWFFEVLGGCVWI